MDVPASSGALSRTEFVAAWRELIAHRNSQVDEVALGPQLLVRGWRWQEHPILRGYGFCAKDPLTRRTVSQALPVDDGLDDLGDIEPVEGFTMAPEDDATICRTPQRSSLASSSDEAGEEIKVVFYSVFSDTYQVPALFFTATYASSGAPLDVQALLRSTIFARSPFASTKPSTQHYPFNTLGDAGNAGPDTLLMLPFLTAAEHPVYGTACWAVHPCNTAEMLRDVMKTEDASPLQGGQYMEAWLMVVGSLVNLREDVAV